MRKRAKRRDWTLVLDELRADYAAGDLKATAAKWGITYHYLRTLASKLGLKRKYSAYRWRPEMIEKLKNEYPTTRHPRLLAIDLGVSFSSLRSKAQILGIKRKVLAYRTKGLRGYEL